MASGSLFFTKSAILPIFDPILQREGEKNLHFRYTTHGSVLLVLTPLPALNVHIVGVPTKSTFVKNNDPEAIFRLFLYQKDLDPR